MQLYARYVLYALLSSRALAHHSIVIGGDIFYVCGT